MNPGTDPIGFLIRAPGENDAPDAFLFYRNRADAEKVLAFRQSTKFPPGAKMRPLYWADAAGDFSLTEPEATP